jgi:hypothetical protein
LPLPCLVLRGWHRGCDVPVRNLALADPEIAGATFKAHLDGLWSTGRPDRSGWVRNDVDLLHTVVTLPAKRPRGETDAYYFRLGAEYYDAAPPTVALVQPDGVTHPPQQSKWFPVLESLPGWFGLHAQYPWPGGSLRQLVCFTLSAEYYMTDHSPKESEEWKQGRHTVAATLNRLAEVLSPQYYRRPGA